jgi:HD-GYP domain-containing protein (c-di-GMP phosphodiesterase class II)
VSDDDLEVTAESSPATPPQTPRVTPPDEAAPAADDVRDDSRPDMPSIEITSSASVVFSARQVKRVREVLARFSGARRAVRFYPMAHPAVRENIATLMSLIGRYHAEGVDLPITFFDSELLLGEQLLPEESILFDQLIRDLSELGLGTLTFLRGLTTDELERALPLLASDAPGIAAMGGLEAAIASSNVPHVMFSPVTTVERGDQLTRPADKREASQASYMGALDLLRELDRLIKHNHMVSAEHVRGVVRSMVDNVLDNRYAMLELSGLKDYDEYTFYHSVNVAILSLALGTMISTDRRFLSSLGVGALMHDIGKMTVDIAVLNKPGALTSDEWAEVRAHPVYGAEAAALLPGLDKAAVPVILEHHMRYDLDGYPQRTPKRAQHIASRIVAVADAYDAMTSRRSYSAARLQDESMEILLTNAGSSFDPVLARLFVRMLGVYPPRSVVRLTSGEVGVVLKPHDTDVTKPTVRVFADAAGAFIDPVDVDLSDAATAAGRRIEACLDASGLNVDVDDYL